MGVQACRLPALKPAMKCHRLNIPFQLYFFMVFLGTIPTSGLRHICHVWPVMPMRALAHNLYIFLRVFLQHAMVITFIYARPQRLYETSHSFRGRP